MLPERETETRMAPDGKHALFSPSLKTMLPPLNEGITGLPADPDTSLLVACPAGLFLHDMAEGEGYPHGGSSAFGDTSRMKSQSDTQAKSD